MSSGEWWKRPPANPDACREAVRAAADECRDMESELVLAHGIIRELFLRPMPRAADVDAERRVLGWMLSGKACIADVAELYADDFTGHRAFLAAWFRELMDDYAPWLPSRAPLVNCVRFVKNEERLADELEAELWRLPYVTKRPELELELVKVLGRRWSVASDVHLGVA